MKTVVIIPARMTSQRFPDKPMAKINGITMIERVWRKAIQSNIGNEQSSEYVFRNAQPGSIHNIKVRLTINNADDLYIKFEVKQPEQDLEKLSEFTDPSQYPYEVGIIRQFTFR